MVEDGAKEDGPVAFVVTREIKPGAAEKYHQLMEEVGDAARAVDPGLNMTMIEQGGSQSDQFVIVLYFSSHQKLEQWERSDARRELRREVEPWETGKASFSEVTGFEYWFSLPKIAATRPPSRYKMALITVIALYLLSLTYTYTLNRWLESLPDHLGIIVRVVILVLVMTFVVMPLLTRLFARWLYPLSSRAGGGRRDAA